MNLNMAIPTIHAMLNKKVKRPFVFSLDILICSLHLTEYDTEWNCVGLDNLMLATTGNNVIILQQQSGFCTKRFIGVQMTTGSRLMELIFQSQ